MKVSEALGIVSRQNCMVARARILRADDDFLRQNQKILRAIKEHSPLVNQIVKVLEKNEGADAVVGVMILFYFLEQIMDVDQLQAMETVTEPLLAAEMTRWHEDGFTSFVSPTLIWLNQFASMFEINFLDHLPHDVNQMAVNGLLIMLTLLLKAEKLQKEEGK